MTKKCLISFIIYTILSAICLVSMHLMLLADVNKYVGVGIGGGILIVSFVLYIIFRKHKNFGAWFVPFYLASAIGGGLAISSLYVYLGIAPTVLHSVCVWVAYVMLFLIYCLLTGIPFFKRFPRICLTIYGLIVLAGGIVGMILLSTIIFSLALMLFILFISYLASMIMRSSNYLEHIHNLTLISFTGLMVIVIVVLIVISQGEGMDGLDITPESGNYRNPKKNPYDFF